MDPKEVIYQSGRKIIILLFGVVFPIVILVQDYFDVASLNIDVGYKQIPNNIVPTVNDVKKTLVNGNDHSLFAVLYTEPGRVRIAYLYLGLD